VPPPAANSGKGSIVIRDRLLMRFPGMINWIKTAQGVAAMMPPASRPVVA
jgi:hypothetical protein